MGETCEHILNTDDCECRPEPVACGDASVPECGGDCPPDERCVEVDIPPTGTVCECRPCAEVGPDPGTGTGGTTGGGLVVTWSGTKDQIRWTPSQCALVYNTYRSTAAGLLDLDRDGLADAYPACYQQDIIALHASDASLPQTGLMHMYLVTAEDFDSETALGTNSVGAERPNTSPCP